MIYAIKVIAHFGALIGMTLLSAMFISSVLHADGVGMTLISLYLSATCVYAFVRFPDFPEDNGGHQ
jgi:hypothetical protein